MVRKLALSWLLIFALFSAFAVGSVSFEVVHASTTLNSQIITSNQTWTKADSPYTFRGPVAVDSGVTLTIEPGATVDMNNNYLEVRGTLIAKGTATDFINFDRATMVFTQTCTGWDEQTGLGSIIEYANFSYGIIPAQYVAQMEIDGATPKLQYIENITSVSISQSSGSQSILHNRIGILTIAQGSQQICDNRISDLNINSGSQTIKGNTVSRAHISGTQSITYNQIGSLQATSPTIISHNTLGSLTLQNCEEISDNIIGHEQSYGGDELHVTGDNPIITSNTMYCGLTVDGSTATISNNSITFATIDEYSSQETSVLSVAVSQSAVISNNKITAKVGYFPDLASLGMRPDHGPFYVDYGISVSGNTEVSRNLVSGCPKASIRLSGSGNTIEHNAFNAGAIIVESSATSNIIRYNNILNGLSLFGSQNIDAANNWWGTTNASAIDDLIHDNDEDFNLGKVNYTPFLTAPDPQVLPDTEAPLPSPVASTPDVTPSTVPTQSPTDIPAQSPRDVPTQSENSQNTANQNPPIDIVVPALIAALASVSVALVVVLIISRKKR